MTLSVFSALSTSVPVAKAQGDVTVFMRPGVPDPYNPGFSHTLGTLVRNPELVLSQYREGVLGSNDIVRMGSQCAKSKAEPWIVRVSNSWLHEDVELVLG